MQTEYIGKNNAKVILSKELIYQIACLHREIPDGKEWSGLLIYHMIQGSLLDHDNLIIRAEGLYPMDIGDATFTTFEGNEDWLKCFGQYPQIDPTNPRPKWYIGKIHSHHTMQVFHSGTDKQDLVDSASKLPLFLSLIVNYRCDTDCKIAIAIEAEETIVTRVKYKMKAWTKAIHELSKAKTKHKPIYLISCDVEYEPETWLIDQINSLKTKKIPVVYENKWNAGHLIEHSYSPSTLKHPPHVYRKMIDCVGSLLTLGLNKVGPPALIIETLNQDVTVAMADKYEDALKAYYLKVWHPKFFKQYVATDEEIINSILTFVHFHEQSWIFKILKDALNDLKETCNELRQIQRSALV